MLDLDAAFARLREREDREAQEAQERQNRTDEAIRLAATECQRSFGGMGKVEVQREAKGVMLNAGNHGWMSIFFKSPSAYRIRIGKQRSDVVPAEPMVTDYNLDGEQKLGDAIAEWYAGLPVPS